MIPVEADYGADQRAFGMPQPESYSRFTVFRLTLPTFPHNDSVSVCRIASLFPSVGSDVVSESVCCNFPDAFVVRKILFVGVWVECDDNVVRSVIDELNPVPNHDVIAGGSYRLLNGSARTCSDFELRVVDFGQVSIAVYGGLGISKTPASSR